MQNLKHIRMKNILLVIAIILGSTSFAQLTLEDIWLSNTYKAKTVEGMRSMNNGEYFSVEESTDNGTNIVLYEFKTGKKIKTVFEASQVKDYPKGDFVFDSYAFSPDESKILFATEEENIYRHSTKAAYYYYDLKTKKLSALSNLGKQMYALFAATSDKIAFVRDNNIFIHNLSSQTETQVTNDGKWNNIINGATDWVYEEEFSMNKALSWSPDGKNLVYYKFDESKVKEYSFPEYGSLYPSEVKYKYPKAGEDNSIVTVHVYNVESAKSQKVDIGTETNQYIPRVGWIDNNNVFVVRLNRLQNIVDVLSYDVLSQKSVIIYHEESKTYIDLHGLESDYITFLPSVSVNGTNQKGFILMSEKDGYNHLYLFDITGKQITQVTKGNWDIVTLLGINLKTNTVFYTSSEVSAIDEDFYSINLYGGQQKKLSNGKGTNEITFNSTFTYYMSKYSEAGLPPAYTLHNSDGKRIRTLEENNKLKSELEKLKLNKKVFFTITTNENIQLNAWMIKPSNFDSTKKYPVLMFVYGGVGKNTVSNNWEGNGYLFHQFLAQKGYIVVSVDNRGTQKRGRDFKNCTYMQLGKLETIDQIESAKYLGKLPYVDNTRIGIQGWSYGGYMSSLCITKGADVFKMAIAVAPVTNWRYYDNIYTERFMRTPQENPSGYDENSPINHVDKLKGKFLLMHGTSDDNVHFQNTMEMTTALIKANKQFDMFVYPNKNHGIKGGNTSLHIYTKMYDFIKANL